MTSSSFEFSRRRLLATTGIAGGAAAFGLLRTGTARANAGPSSYTASWASVDQHPPAPEVRPARQGLGEPAVFNKLKEVVDGYQPDILYQDFDLNLIDESQRLNFLAYYYNRAVDWNKDVVATYKDGFNNRGEVFDFERGRAG